MNYEKELRKRAYIVMHRHTEMITDNVNVTVGQVANMLKVSKPTARKFLKDMCINGTMDWWIKVSGKKETTMYFLRYTDITTKEWDRAVQAYQDLLHEMSV